MNNEFNYAGPTALYASITGSPLWGLKVEEVVLARQHSGWRLNFGERVQTPYGLGPQVFHFTVPGNGREVIWIPSYGGILGEDFDSVLTPGRRLFWILWKAGVKVLLIGGTGGTNDWRDPSAEKAIRPGDVMLPWSFIRQQPMLGVLPGTGIGGLLPNLPRLADPFCVGLSDWLADRLESIGFFRRVHRTSDVHVILKSPLGEGSFESAAETLQDRVLARLMSDEGGIPVVYEHGDCISPLMCRHLGIHQAYYHIAANWAEGHPAAEGVLTEKLDALYVDDLPHRMLDFENAVLQSVQIPIDCTCLSLLKKRPDVYMKAMTSV